MFKIIYLAIYKKIVEVLVILINKKDLIKNLDKKTIIEMVIFI